MAGAPAGGPAPAGAAGRAARIRRTATRSSTVAITRSRSPQRGQTNTSIANARRMWREHAKVETELGLQERCVLVIHFPDPTQPNRAMDYPPGTMTEEELDHYRWKGKVRPAGPGLGS